MNPSNFRGNTTAGKKQPPEKQHAAPVLKAKEPIQMTQLTNKITKKPIDLGLVNSAYDMAVDSLKGQALASSLGAALKKSDSTFDIRNYGFSSLRKFMEALQPQYKTIVHDDKLTISLKKSDR